MIRESRGWSHFSPVLSPVPGTEPSTAGSLVCNPGSRPESQPGWPNGPAEKPATVCSGVANGGALAPCILFFLLHPWYAGLRGQVVRNSWGKEPPGHSRHLGLAPWVRGLPHGSGEQRSQTGQRSWAGCWQKRTPQLHFKSREEGTHQTCVSVASFLVLMAVSPGKAGGDHLCLTSLQLHALPMRLAPWLGVQKSRLN